MKDPEPIIIMVEPTGGRDVDPEEVAYEILKTLDFLYEPVKTTS